MRTRSAFEIFLRTGRGTVESKFNPWHDPEDGRFTFAGQGRYFGGRLGRATSVQSSGVVLKVGSSASSAVPKTIASAAPRPKAIRPKDAVPGISSRNPRPPRPAAIRPLAAQPTMPKSPARRFGPSVLRTSGLPVDGGVRDRAPQNPVAQENHSKLNGSRGGTSVRTHALPSRLRPIPGYTETGTASWRAANDQVFIQAADRFNKAHGFTPGHPQYVDPLLVKAWAMVESGGSKSAFLRDPLQVNNPGDWVPEKQAMLGLTKGQVMTPPVSTDQALKWLDYKGRMRDRADQPRIWQGLEYALRRYNGNPKPHPSGVPHSVWYARHVLKLHAEAKKGS